MKKNNLIRLFVLLCFPFHAFTQDITGLWKGELYNDTTQLYLPYELAISETDGKLSGYSYTMFTIDGKQEVGIKKLKIRKKKDKILIEDVQLISNNYSATPPKGVHQYSVISLLDEDSILVLSGLWSTNRTKHFRPLTGTMRVQRKNDFQQSPLVKKLDELKLTEKLSFLPPEQKTGAVAIVEKPATKKGIESAMQEKKTPPPPEEKEKRKVAEPDPVVDNIPEEPRQEKIPGQAVEKIKQDPSLPVVKAEPTIRRSVIIPPASDVANRKIANMQSVFYSADSLILTLYDNGEVDGDTVSVLMNGQLIFSKEGLTTKANSKTIYITPDTPDSLVLVMYAESLGSIPPNTGLLVVKDGESVYEVRFSADLKTNAAIILRRKKKG